MKEPSARKRSRNSGSERNATPALEWILGVAGALLLLASLAYLIGRASEGEDQPGAVTMVAYRITPAGEAWLVQFSIHNAGAQTLADLHVSAQLFDGTTEVDHAQAVIDYLPGRSRRRGGFYLRHDPRQLRLVLAVRGFQEP